MLERLGDENFAGMRDDVATLGIDCRWSETGTCQVALEPHELDWLRAERDLARRFGEDPQLLDAVEMREQIDSPAFLGGLWQRDGGRWSTPRRWRSGCAMRCVARGVRVHEHRRCDGWTRRGVAVEVSPSSARARPAGAAGHQRIPAAAGADARLRGARVRLRAGHRAAQRRPAAAIGWAAGQGLSDLGNQFHYCRPTADGRILLGGYDAVYRRGGPVSPRWDAEGDATYGAPVGALRRAVPRAGRRALQPRVGRGHRHLLALQRVLRHRAAGRVAYAVGYTGLGVAATRFGAQVALDLLDGRQTEATRLRYVRAKPVPFPPEPLRSAVIQATRNRLAAADANGGRRGLWLRTLDRLGLGFDS